MPVKIDPRSPCRVEAALGVLQSQYPDWAASDLARLRDCLTEVPTEAPPHPDTLLRLFAVAHDIKGQAATFGYPLAGELGARLCHLVEGAPKLDAAERDRMVRLVAAIERVITGRLDGDGGDEGRRLLASTRKRG